MSDEEKCQQEIAELRQELAEITTLLARRHGDAARLQRRVVELEAQIKKLEGERNFFRDQNNINLADNRHLRDILRRNPYSDDFYNEN